MQVISDDFQSFIDNYSPSDSEWIAVEWNGKYGGKFKDDNYLFRIQIAELVCEQLDTVDLVLLRELFINLGMVTKLNFSVYNKFHLLAETLLERGGTEYLYDYLCAAHISFDTFLSTARINLSTERLEELIVYFDYLKETELDTEVQKMLSEHMRNRLEELKNKA
ncbi:hypothetical protein [Myroides sp. N17-2]|uniref:hypothetical protein n=1 Tax=Myroides sp. N17-2 TaxID=2030799 RepID=UPI000EFCF429|nr:hypothetical protein [Myroides sp. N17-2]